MIPLKMLFVEDDQVDQLAFQRFVEEHGLPITYVLAGSLSEAKCLVGQGEFDLIVADYSLGDGTALDLLPFAQGVPMILLTGVGDEETAARAFTAGISDYLVKDIGRNYLEQLPERMEKVVGQRLRSGGTLQESGERYRTLVENMGEGIGFVDLKEQFAFANAAAEDIFGVPPSGLLGRSLLEFAKPEQLDMIREQTDRRRAGEKGVYEIEISRPNGEKRNLLITAVPQFDNQGKVVGTFGVFRDITERKKAEEALRESEERYRRILDLSQEGIWVLDEQFQTTFVNSQISQWLGYPSEEIVGHPMEEFVFQEDVPDHRKQMQERQRIIDSQYERRFQRNDGGVVWAIVSAKAISRDDRFQGSFSMLTDITERKKTEEALQKSGAQYRLLADNMKDQVWMLDLNLNPTYISPSVEKTRGYTFEEIAQLPLEKQLTATSFQSVMEFFSIEMPKVLADPTYLAPSLELEFYRKDGSTLWAETMFSLIWDENGQPLSILGVARDITERKKTEEALQKNEALYRLLADNMKDQVWLMDLNLKPTYVSPSVEKMRGYTFEEIAQLPLDKQLTATSYQSAIEFFSIEMPKALADPTYFAHSLELEFYRKDGSTLWFENMFSLIWDENGKPLSLLGVGREITERKQAEEALALNFETQAAMNALLGLSLESRTIKEFLARSLDLVLSLKWLAVESKGAIFLAENAGEMLHLHVQKGLSKDLSVICSTVPFGRCMCGRAAAGRIIQFADRVDERHDTRYEGMQPHGHYCVPISSGDQILGVINLYVKEGHTRSPWEEDFLKAVANTLAGTLERRRAEEELTATHEKLRQSLDSTILVLASVAEMRDPYTAGHQQRVSELAQAIAKELNLPEEQVEGIRVAGLLHDLGKMQIPAEILSKPGKLTSVELMLIRTHSQSGYEILKSTVFPWPLAQFVLQHHERWDGSGYPAGMKGEEISLEARILAVADVVEAMSSHRPYRPAFEAHEALWEILQNKGTLYDIAVAEACQRVFEVKQFRFRSQVG